MYHLQPAIQRNNRCQGQPKKINPTRKGQLKKKDLRMFTIQASRANDRSGVGIGLPIQAVPGVALICA